MKIILRNVLTAFGQKRVHNKIKDLRKLIVRDIEKKLECNVVAIEPTEKRGIEKIIIYKKNELSFAGELKFDFIDNGKTVTIKFEFTSN